ncbi:hypothetical protein Tco_0502188, partial [Tanacetum coccineum]
IPGLAHQPAGLQEGLGGPVRDSRVSSSKTLLGSVVEDFGLLCTAPSDRERYRTPSEKACSRNLDQTSPTPVSEYLSMNNNNITACRVYKKSFYKKEDGPADCTRAPVDCFVKASNAPSWSNLAGVWGSEVTETIAEETGGMLAVCVGIEDDDGLDIDWEVENKSPPNIAVENEDDRPGLARPQPARKLGPLTPCDGRGPEVAASLTDLLEVQNIVQKDVGPLDLVELEAELQD